ncbi:MAG TPA: cellulase family glycosylhydrolase [Patescibacteria group bacterium]|jgi:hypothetical protein|nr:cellulase family glycosylhydrolase [Patescibacteria group bacterium]
MKINVKKRHGRRNLFLAIIVGLILLALCGVWLKSYGVNNHGLTQHITKPVIVVKDKIIPIQNTYGIAAGSSLTHVDSQTMLEQLDGIAALGVQWVRLDFDWSIVQPDDSHTFDWSHYDKIVAAANDRHLNILGILAYTPSWARSSTCPDSSKCAPADPAQFAAFASAAATRYASQGVHYWEIWNEPNSHDFWKPKSDPVAYVELLKQTWTSLKKADSKAFIITAGLSPQADTDVSYSPISFLAGVYKAGGKDYFDAVGDHPYTFPLSPKSKENHAWNQMVATNKSLRQIMVSNGDGDKKIWVTEFGAPTGGPGTVYLVDENQQKQMILDALTLFKSYSWAGPFFWYSYKDAGNTPDTNENFFGLVRYDSTPKPAYNTFKDWISNNSLTNH